MSSSTNSWLYFCIKQKINLHKWSRNVSKRTITMVIKFWKSHTSVTIKTRSCDSYVINDYFIVIFSYT